MSSDTWKFSLLCHLVEKRIFHAAVEHGLLNIFGMWTPMTAEAWVMIYVSWEIRNSWHTNCASFCSLTSMLVCVCVLYTVYIKWESSFGPPPWWQWCMQMQRQVAPINFATCVLINYLFALITEAHVAYDRNALISIRKGSAGSGWTKCYRKWCNCPRSQDKGKLR